MSQPKLDRITQDPNVLDGLPTIRDTGITVSEVVKALMGGKTADEVLAEHPQVENEDMTQALVYSLHDTMHTILVWDSYIVQDIYSSSVTAFILKEDLQSEQEKKDTETIFRLTEQARRKTLHLRYAIELLYKNNLLFWQVRSVTKIVEGIKLDLRLGFKETKFSYEVNGEDKNLHCANDLSWAIATLLDSAWDGYDYDQSNLKVKSTSSSITFKVSRIYRWKSMIPKINEHFFADAKWPRHPVALAAHIIRQHGSELKIHPTEDGVTFEFELPIWREEK